MRYILLLGALFFLFFPSLGRASVISSKDSVDTLDPIVYEIGDVVVIGPYSFQSQREEKRYIELESDLCTIYPFILIVRSEYDKVNREFAEVYGDKKRRKSYMKWYEKRVKELYMDSLTSSVSISQGRLLLKLISRETGATPYELIKDYRGGGKAFLWRSVALLMGANLNSKYKPEKEPLMEHILRRIESGQLEYDKVKEE